MALSMPRPFAHKTGVFFLNARVPTDLARRLRGSRVILPVGDALATVSVTDKIFLSLRTKDPNVARERFAATYAALVAHWIAAREGPKPLTHRQIVALAGETYRRRIETIEGDPEHGPYLYEKDRALNREAFESFKRGDPGDRELDEAEALLLAAIQRPFGPQLLALELGCDVDTAYCKVTYAEALEDLFGFEADRVCAAHALTIDPTTRSRLLVEIGKAMDKVGTRVAASAAGDYSVDHSQTFPAFTGPTVAASSPLPTHAKKSISAQVERFVAYNADKRAPSTLRRYGPSLDSFVRFHKDGDIRLVTGETLLSWAEHRRDVDRISVPTINGNDLVAVKSLFSFTKAKAGGSLRCDNPTDGIRLDGPRSTQDLDKKFSIVEIAAILLLARRARPRKGYPRASACRRWAPWICAYTGARIQEVCSLERKDVRRRDGVWTIHLPRTKEAISRWVVVHEALIDEGFVAFCEGAPEGPLFTGDKPQKASATRSTAEQRASEMATWIRANVALEATVSPNHAWRHTFITAAREAKFYPLEMIDVITGHNRKKNAAAGYYSPSPRAMSIEMAKYPRYELETHP